MNKQKQGKRNLRKGRIFENKVREDLESKGFIVSRWCNNVEFENPDISLGSILTKEGQNKRDLIRKGKKQGRCIPAKQGRFRKISTGFPDFIAYEFHAISCEGHKRLGWFYEVNFVECKTNGYLDKEEKEKAKWYLENNYCSEFWVAYKETDPKDKRKSIVKYDEIHTHKM